MERRGFFRSLLGLAALPFVPIKDIVKAMESRPKSIWISFESAATTWYGSSTTANTGWQILSINKFTDSDPWIYEEPKKPDFWKEASLEDIK